MTDPTAPEALDRTRSSVLNVLIVAAAGIAASGWALGRHVPDVTWPAGWSATRAHEVALMALGAIAVGAFVTLRAGANRVAVASLAALAVPLGFAHGWLVDPDLRAIAPFWVVAVGLGGLAWPRGEADPT